MCLLSGAQKTQCSVPPIVIKSDYPVTDHNVQFSLLLLIHKAANFYRYPKLLLWFRFCHHIYLHVCPILQFISSQTKWAKLWFPVFREERREFRNFILQCFKRSLQCVSKSSRHLLNMQIPGIPTCRHPISSIRPKDYILSRLYR